MAGVHLLSFISSIEPLNGENYVSWRGKIELALALSDIDLALTTACPVAPVDLMREENESDEDFSARMRDFEPIKMKYDLARAQWDQSNRKCLIVIKSCIMEAIRGGIPECTTAREYLKTVESLFTRSSMAYATTLIKRLVTEKYTGGGIREHILRMSSMASKLKPMDICFRNEFVIHLILASLPKEFEVLMINFNSQPDKWDIGKLIALSVQQEERIKGSHGDSINDANQNKKRTFYHHQISNHENVVDKDTCRWCKKKGHYKKDCVHFLEYLRKKGIPYEENPAKRIKIH